MNNTDKLLRAFIEASGYEIRETATAASINDRNYAIAKGCTFDPALNYDYRVTKKGEVKAKSWAICDKCKGSGSYIYAKAHCDCSNCDGTGKVLL